MARIIRSNALPEFMDTETSLWIYNALDSSVTVEVGNVLHNMLLEKDQLSTYVFALGMMAPAFQMMTRGIRVDQVKRGEVESQLSAMRARLEGMFQRLSMEIAGSSTNHRSTDQMKKFFYEVMAIPPIEIFDYSTKTKKISVGREAMEKIQAYFYAGPIARLILAMRDLDKKLQVVRAGVDPDGRMRCSYNVVGTETGRWSSSKNAFGGGTNNQNITDEMREMFIPDSGKKLGYNDLEQAESKAVAMLSGDRNYIEACASGDLHTFVSRMVWPGMPWTGELKKDKAIAEEIFYRHFTYRDMAKRGGHLTNYKGKPTTMAHHLKIKRELAEAFQSAYFAKFPGIPMWHAEVARTIATDMKMITKLGFVRWFFGRLQDEATIREAIAFEPQSMIGQILNIGLYRTWKELDPHEVEILAQVHDAYLYQYDENRELEIVPKTLKLMRVPVQTKHGILDIPTEAATGWNWRKASKDKQGNQINPWGLQKFNGKLDQRQRPQRLAYTGYLDRVVSA